MPGGKSGKNQVPKAPEGILTRGGRTTGIPRPSSPGTPKMASPQQKANDTQRVLDKLDGIEKRLEAKIDDAIKSQEFSSSQLKENLKKNDEKFLVQDERISALKEDTSGVRD